MTVQDISTAELRSFFDISFTKTYNHFVSEITARALTGQAGAPRGSKLAEA
jgi:hypothetical protein